MTTVVILLGAPGAGKGTQAARLAVELSMPHVSTGDLFRENLSKGTPLGDKARGFMDAGELVPDELVLEMLFDRVARPDCSAGYLLDGFPRTVAQAEALESRLNQGAGDKPLIIDIQVPDEAIERRIVQRRTCADNGHIFNLESSPPKQEGVCDQCGSKLIQRKDDTSEVVRTRLEEYHEKTAPLVGFYGTRGAICVVNGQNSPDEVFAACVACIPTSKGGVR
ncbi:MAG: adenylate kinase [Planctomycetota bacterium]